MWDVRSNPSHSFINLIYIHHHSLILLTSSSPTFISFIFRPSLPATGNRRLRQPKVKNHHCQQKITRSKSSHHHLLRSLHYPLPPTTAWKSPYPCTNHQISVKITIFKQNPPQTPLIITPAPSATTTTFTPPTAICTQPPPHNHWAKVKLTKYQYKSTKTNRKSPAA